MVVGGCCKDDSGGRIEKWKSPWLCCEH
jgi:hypothetical protein